MFKCGITGHSGILGNKIIKKLNFKFNKFKGNISNKNDVEKWLKSNNFDLIIHLAAIVPTHIVKKNFKLAKKVNYAGTVNLVNAINKLNLNLKWFFFSSTSHVYKASFKLKFINEKSKKKPFTKYGKTKLLAEHYIKKKLSKKYKVCIGRIFSFTDKNQKLDYFIPSIVNKIKKSKSERVIFNNLDHYRDFISTEDIVTAIFKLWKKRSVGEFNIATGNKIYLKKIVLYICKKFKKVPIILNQKNKITYLIADINKLKKQVKWFPKKHIKYIIANYLN